VWNAATGQEMARLEHSGPVNSAAFSPNGLVMVTASFDKTALWNAATGQVIGMLEDVPAGAPRILLASAAVGDDLVNTLRLRIPPRTLIYEKFDKADDAGKPEKATYVVNPNPGPSARLVADIALKHDVSLPPQ
jgi:WD40 repeat protein